MLIPVCAAGFAALVAAVILLVKSIRERRTEKEMVARLRTTALYSHIYPRFRKFDEIWLESVTFRPESVTFRMISPYGWTYCYNFNQHGLDDPTPETLYALALAAAVDMPVLRNRRHYAFRTLTETFPSGEKQFSYEYTMRKRWHEEALQQATLPPDAETEDE